VAEAIAALSWVTVAPAPVPYVKEMAAAGDFYGNKVLTEFKGKDENMVNFVKSFKELINDLSAYVKDFHTTGLSWNSKGGKATEFNSSSAAAPKPAAEYAAAPVEAPKPATAAPSKPAGGNMFAELSKGGDITAGLKKVTRDMTNKDKKIDSLVSADAVAKVDKDAEKMAAALKDPVFELQGNKWMVEYQVDRSDLQITAERSQTVLLFKCVGKKSRTVVTIDGKVNAVSIDGCNKTSVVVHSVVSTIDMVNCNNCEVQIIGKCPTLNIDKCSGVMVYLSKENVDDIQIVTAKSSAMNIQLPAASDDHDPVEIPVPEQFLTVVKGGKLVTETVNHSGG